MTTAQNTEEKRKTSTAISSLLGIMLFSGLMIYRWYVKGGEGAGATGKAFSVAAGALIIVVWWALSIPLARRVEKRNSEGLRALFWLPWIGLSITLCIVYFALFVSRLPMRLGANLGGSFAFLLTAPVVFASSWRNSPKGPNKASEATPGVGPPAQPSPSSGAPQL